MRKLARSLREKLLSESKIILDTSFLLPYVGLRVKEVRTEIMNWLREIDQYYPYMMIPELVGVIIRVSRKMNVDSIPDQALKGFNSIVYGDSIRLIEPMDEDLSIAYDLTRRGLRDIFDAILYATSRRLGIKAITMDSSLVEFLKRNNFEADNIILIT
ncbi:PIN domain-containing protein [Candidatus Bathyarchaeota archaeon]|nr:MAG: PIN domain-containing protein [Candidatus Bathyarchaeota archaeon]